MNSNNIFSGLAGGFNGLSDVLQFIAQLNEKKAARTQENLRLETEERHTNAYRQRDLSQKSEMARLQRELETSLENMRQTTDRRKQVSDELKDANIMADPKALDLYMGATPDAQKSYMEAAASAKTGLKPGEAKAFDGGMAYRDAPTVQEISSSSASSDPFSKYVDRATKFNQYRTTRHAESMDTWEKLHPRPDPLMNNDPNVFKYWDHQRQIQEMKAWKDIDNDPTSANEKNILDIMYRNIGGPANQTPQPTPNPQPAQQGSGPSTDMGQLVPGMKRKVVVR